ncbi:alpha/beta hydrolase [Penicillium frequentans]|uniref:Alpha/beta hydrolase n=1 Tax=Penicillium frequentans TaxID=3151616 RepID=A0AAD6CU01_9EURO|nr:alpha/beta hydrolase [Penicillium glabrum]
MEHFQYTADIGTHSLSYALRGTARQPGSPLVIILTEITSSALEWSPVCRHIESEASILLYERSGYGRSEESPNEPDSLTIVNELSRLLAAADLKPPYLIVGHSWGGILAREFIAARPSEDICGLVLVDPVQERMLFESWPDPSIAAVTEGLDYMEVVGLTRDHRLTEQSGSSRIFRSAGVYWQKKQQLLPGRDLLKGKPVSVLQGNSKRDHELLYQVGVAQGGGNEAQRAKFREYLATWEESEEAFQRELLNLSSTARFSTTTRSGHNIQLTEPELVAEEIQWVLQRT